MATLAERLGYGPDDRVLIINCDDLGSCHAANVGIYEALREGVATSASLMVPCPWAREAASRYRGEDVGVPRTQRDLWDHADLDEARRELRAQIERAILWGFDVSHLDSHMGTLQLKAEFFDVYLDLAVDFGLPIRLSDASTERLIGFPFRKLAEEEGIVFPDHFVPVRSGVGSRRAVEAAVHELQPGVTEVNVHPAVDTAELRALTPDWAARVDDHDLVVTDHSLRTMLDRAGAVLIGYRELRDLQRRG